MSRAAGKMCGDHVRKSFSCNSTAIAQMCSLREFHSLPTNIQYEQHTRTSPHYMAFWELMISLLCSFWNLTSRTIHIVYISVVQRGKSDCLQQILPSSGITFFSEKHWGDMSPRETAEQSPSKNELWAQDAVFRTWPSHAPRGASCSLCHASKIEH